VRSQGCIPDQPLTSHKCAIHLSQVELNNRLRFNQLLQAHQPGESNLFAALPMFDTLPLVPDSISTLLQIRIALFCI
jgi:hypothetical protein